MSIFRYTCPECFTDIDPHTLAPHECDTRLMTLRERNRTLEADAAIGQLVRRKLVSGNDVPVERCTITAAEVAAIDAARS